LSSDKRREDNQDETQAYEPVPDEPSPHAETPPPDATSTYDTTGEGLDETMVYGADETAAAPPPPEGEKTRTHNLGVGDLVPLGDVEYQITQLLTGDHDTLEAVIYRVEDPDRNDLVVKLYKELPKPQEPNDIALKRIREIEDPSVLSLLAYGTGLNKWRDKFCYEISPYAAGGDLLSIEGRTRSVEEMRAKYTPEFLREQVVPQIFAGVKSLHESRIIHGDLKPQNVFYLDQDQTRLAIGDYGSSKTQELGREIQGHQTLILKGTDFYCAVDQKLGYVRLENDYFSFGMILLHLMYPQLQDREARKGILERQNSHHPIMDFAEDRFGDLNKLVDGLTLRDTDNRWCLKEVEAWLRGESDRLDVSYSSKNRAFLNLGKGVATVHNESGLAKYLESNKDWYKTLFANERPVDLLLNFIGELPAFGLAAQSDFREMMTYYHERHQPPQNYVRTAFLRFLQPECPVRIGDVSYDFFGEGVILSEVLQEAMNHLDRLWQGSRGLERVRVHFFELEFVLRQILDRAVDSPVEREVRGHLVRIASALGAGETKPEADFSNRQVTMYSKLTHEGLARLFYSYNENRVLEGEGGVSINSLESFALHLANRPGQYDDRRMRAERQVFLDRKNRTDLKELSYNEFLLTALSKHIKTSLAVEGVDHTAASNPGPITVHYTLGRSLTDYFKANNVANKLVTVEASGQHVDLRLGWITTLSAGGVYGKLCRVLSKERNVDIKTIGADSENTCKERLGKFVKEYKGERWKVHGRRLWNIVDVVYGGRSALYLLPAFALTVLTMCMAFHHSLACQLLATIPFFDFATSDMLWLERAMNLDSPHFGVNALMLICFLPAAILSILRRNRMRSGSWPDVKKIIKRMAIFLILGPIFLGIAGMGLTAISGIVSDPGAYLNIATGILGLYIFIGVLTVIKATRRMYRSEPNFKLVPFGFSLAPYALASVLYLGLAIPSSIDDLGILPAGATNHDPREIAIVTEPAVNVRADASTQSPVQGIVYHGDSLMVLGRKGSWIHIRSGQLEGYVYQNLVHYPGDKP